MDLIKLSDCGEIIRKTYGLNLSRETLRKWVENKTNRVKHSQPGGMLIVDKRSFLDFLKRKFPH